MSENAGGKPLSDELTTELADKLVRAAARVDEIENRGTTRRDKPSNSGTIRARYIVTAIEDDSIYPIPGWQTSPNYPDEQNVPLSGRPDLRPGDVVRILAPIRKPDEGKPPELDGFIASPTPADLTNDERSRNRVWNFSPAGAGHELGPGQWILGVATERIAYGKIGRFQISGLAAVRVGLLVMHFDNITGTSFYRDPLSDQDFIDAAFYDGVKYRRNPKQTNPKWRYSELGRNADEYGWGGHSGEGQTIGIDLIPASGFGKDGKTWIDQRWEVDGRTWGHTLQRLGDPSRYFEGIELGGMARFDVRFAFSGSSRSGFNMREPYNVLRLVWLQRLDANLDFRWERGEFDKYGNGTTYAAEYNLARSIAWAVVDLNQSRIPFLAENNFRTATQKTYYFSEDHGSRTTLDRWNLENLVRQPIAETGRKYAVARFPRDLAFWIRGRHGYSKELTDGTPGASTGHTHITMPVGWLSPRTPLVGDSHYVGDQRLSLTVGGLSPLDESGINSQLRGGLPTEGNANGNNSRAFSVGGRGSPIRHRHRISFGAVPRVYGDVWPYDQEKLPFERYYVEPSVAETYKETSDVSGDELDYGVPSRLVRKIWNTGKLYDNPAYDPENPFEHPQFFREYFLTAFAFDGDRKQFLRLPWKEGWSVEGGRAAIESVTISGGSATIHEDGILLELSSRPDPGDHLTGSITFDQALETGPFSGLEPGYETTKTLPLTVKIIGYRFAASIEIWYHLAHWDAGRWEKTGLSTTVVSDNRGPLSTTLEGVTFFRDVDPLTGEDLGESEIFRNWEYMFSQQRGTNRSTSPRISFSYVIESIDKGDEFSAMMPGCYVEGAAVKTDITVPGTSNVPEWTQDAGVESVSNVSDRRVCSFFTEHDKREGDDLPETGIRWGQQYIATSTAESLGSDLYNFK